MEQTRASSIAKKEKIMEAASQLFVEKGFTQTSMDEIAQVAGVSKQTVYSHYGDKNSLFVGAVQSKCIAHSMGDGGIDPNRPIRDFLLDIAKHFHDLLLSKEAVNVRRICMANAESHPEVSQLFYDAGPKSLVQVVHDYLEIQSRKGVLVIDNVEFSAWQFLCMLRGDVIMRSELGLPENHTPEELEAYRSSCVDVFLKAYSA